MRPSVERILYILAFLLPASHAAEARDGGLFTTTSQNPFIQIFSLPSPAPEPMPDAGDWTWRFTVDVTNNAILDENHAGERIVLDGETYRSTLAMRLGLSRRVVSGISVPFVAHSGGFLDSSIAEWHDLLGFSNDRRTQFAQNSLDFSFTEGPIERFALRDRRRGIGDVRLTADWQSGDPDPTTRNVTLRGGLKLPTGTSKGLLGSGSTDISLQLMSTDRVTLSAWNMTLGWMVGGLWLGEGRVLEELRRDAVAIASIGVSRPLWHRFTARLQLDGHSAFYDSDLRPLGADGIQLTFGGTIELARTGRIDIAIVESLFTDTTPDVGLHLGWRREF